MPTTKKNSSVKSVPHYAMPDASIPAYDEILEQLQDYQHSLIGSSYYYIRADDNSVLLCRIIPGGGKIFFHEFVDHEKYGITDDELELVVNQDTDQFPLDGYYPISAHIESKLRVILDYP